MSKKYIARGKVLGKCWGGGFGAYPTRELEADSYKDLIKQAKEALKDGSLDSGMGFESLKGAYLDIETIETIQHKGKKFSNSECLGEFIGKLTEKEEDFLTGVEY